MARDYCETCTAVAGGGRIRLTETNALLLLDMAQQRRGGLLSDRRYAIETGQNETVLDLKEQLKDLDLLIKETEATQREMGWLDGQPVRTHP